MSGFFIRLLPEVLRRSDIATGTPVTWRRGVAVYRQATALIQANFGSKLTRDEVARAAGLSPFHFSRLFHQ